MRHLRRILEPLGRGAAVGPLRRAAATLAGIALLCLALAARAQQPGPRASSALAPTVSLSPSVVMLKGQPGQSTTQKLTLSNLADREFSFDLVAEDVVVRDGRRFFVPAGETPRGIAATAVFNPKSVTIKPHDSASSDVTFTVPAETGVRAVVAIFRSNTRLQVNGGVGMTASLGTLLTFTLSNNFAVEGTPIEVQPQTPTANASFRSWLTNVGTEPVIPEGVVAVLTDAGKLVGKAVFQSQRLLPGERLAFAADYPSQLAPGRYRLVASLQYEGKTVSLPGTFSVE